MTTHLPLEVTLPSSLAANGSLFCFFSNCTENAAEVWSNCTTASGPCPIYLAPTVNCSSGHRMLGSG
jgi:hypothetical protein